MPRPEADIQLPRFLTAEHLARPLAAAKGFRISNTLLCVLRFLFDMRGVLWLLPTAGGRPGGHAEGDELGKPAANIEQVVVMFDGLFHGQGGGGDGFEADSAGFALESAPRVPGRRDSGFRRPPRAC